MQLANCQKLTLLEIDSNRLEGESNVERRFMHSDLSADRLGFACLRARADVDIFQAEIKARLQSLVVNA